MKPGYKDIEYCGVNKKKIRQAKPMLNGSNFKVFVHFIKERYRIHKRKDIQKLSPPWTKDPILQKYRFTNVRREHDTQSKALIERVSLNSDLSLEDKIVNTFMFRSWNNYETFDFFRLPEPAKRLYHPTCKEFRRKLYRNEIEINSDRKWFSAAYNQGGMKSAWRNAIIGDTFTAEQEIPLRPFHIPSWLQQGKIADKIISANDQQEVYEVIKSVHGFSDFMAYQIFVDITYTPEFRFSENEFTVPGPGCKHGLDYIFDDMDELDHASCIFWIRDNFDWICEEAGIRWNPEKLFSDLPSHDRCLNVMMLENVFCEFSKYMRAYEGTGRPKVKYKPTI